MVIRTAYGTAYGTAEYLEYSTLRCVLVLYRCHDSYERTSGLGLGVWGQLREEPAVVARNVRIVHRAWIIGPGVELAETLRVPKNLDC